MALSSVGSSGVEYALMAEWTASGLALWEGGLAPAPAPWTGSRWSPAASRRRPSGRSATRWRTASTALRSTRSSWFRTAVARQSSRRRSQSGSSFAAGRSVILYTALGPKADRGAEIDSQEGARHRLGRNLGAILRALVPAEVDASGYRRRRHVQPCARTAWRRSADHSRCRFRKRPVRLSASRTAPTRRSTGWRSRSRAARSAIFFTIAATSIGRP